MSKKRKIVGYSLYTGERRVFASVTEAARTIGTDPSYICVALKKNRTVLGWCLADLDHEHCAIELYERGGEEMQAKATRLRKPARCNNGKVSLRIDSHTVIWVKPEDATEEYIKRYKEDLELTRRRI